MVLYESILHPEGAEYHILEVFALKNPELLTLLMKILEDLKAG